MLGWLVQPGAAYLSLHVCLCACTSNLPAGHAPSWTLRRRGLPNGSGLVSHACFTPLPCAGSVSYTYVRARHLFHFATTPTRQIQHADPSTSHVTRTCFLTITWYHAAFRYPPIRLFLLHAETKKPGVYALCVFGRLSKEVSEEAGVMYRNRDTSKELGAGT